MSDFRNSARLSGRTVVWGTAVIATVAALSFIAAYAFGAFSDTTAERRGQTDQQEQTVGDGTYRIAQYDQFFNACQAIVATEGDIAATREQIASGTDQTQKFYDQQNLRAQEAQRRSLIAQYNADAAKTATAGQFRDSNLPSSINQNGTTTCAAR